LVVLYKVIVILNLPEIYGKKVSENQLMYVWLIKDVPRTKGFGCRFCWRINLFWWWFNLKIRAKKQKLLQVYPKKLFFNQKKIAVPNAKGLNSLEDHCLWSSDYNLAALLFYFENQKNSKWKVSIEQKNNTSLKF
jgi:hypothetical protein